METGGTTKEWYNKVARFIVMLAGNSLALLACVYEAEIRASIWKKKSSVVVSKTAIKTLKNNMRLLCHWQVEEMKKKLGTEKGLLHSKCIYLLRIPFYSCLPLSWYFTSIKLFSIRFIMQQGNSIMHFPLFKNMKNLFEIGGDTNVRGKLDHKFYCHVKTVFLK